ncbi:helix-turn-helix domain-containing protein [Jatrophihabitans fulvus]
MTGSKKRAPAGTGAGASMGQFVRQQREAAGLSVRELGRRVGVSASFLSQFELGQSQAAVNTLFAIASELNLSLDDVLAHSIEPESPKPRPRSAPRAAETPPDRDTDGTDDDELPPPMDKYLSFQTGVRWKRLATLGQDRVDFLLTEYEPGADSAPEDSPQVHRGDDYGYVLEGTLTVVVKGRRRKVHAGKAIAMRGSDPHRLLNETDELVRAIWFVTD